MKYKAAYKYPQLYLKGDHDDRIAIYLLLLLFFSARNRLRGGRQGWEVGVHVTRENLVVNWSNGLGF